MKTLVTGAGGFIGSHLSEALLKDAEGAGGGRGTEVWGIDAPVNPHLWWLKERNLAGLNQHPMFHFVKEDIRCTDWEDLLEGVKTVFHLAAIPGVRTSWGSGFRDYVDNNIIATQHLLEACKNHSRRGQSTLLVFASSSSVYGEKPGRVEEGLPLTPLSPYGITKLTCEHLCQVYNRRYGIPVIILRYFTVYGPRQRPDMAFHRFIKAMLRERPITVYGDGHQTRDFTYVSDCVEATAACINAQGAVGRAINIGGRERASVLDVIALLEKSLQREARLEFSAERGDEPKHTWADTSRAEELLGYRPKVSLQEGLSKELDYLRGLDRDVVNNKVNGS